jgi:hypothetical protein
MSLNFLDFEQHVTRPEAALASYPAIFRTRTR